VGLLFERGVPALAAGWLLFLLVPLSSTGLAFPSFLFVLGLTVLLGTLSLRRRVSYPMGAGSSMNAASSTCRALPAGRSKTRVKHLERAWYHLYSVF